MGDKNAEAWKKTVEANRKLTLNITCVNNIVMNPQLFSGLGVNSISPLVLCSDENRSVYYNRRRRRAFRQLERLQRRRSCSNTLDWKDPFYLKLIYIILVDLPGLAETVTAEVAVVSRPVQLRSHLVEIFPSATPQQVNLSRIGAQLQIAEAFVHYHACQYPPIVDLQFTPVHHRRPRHQHRHHGAQISEEPVHLGIVHCDGRHIVGRHADPQISGKIAKEVFEEMYRTGKPAAGIVQAKGLTQISGEDELARIVDDIIKANPDNVERYRSGKATLFGFFVGEAMKATKGKANPQVINRLLKEKLGG